MATTVIDKKEKFLEQLRPSGNVDGLSKLAELSLQELDFPTTRDEYWKYTRLAKIQNGDYHVADSDSAPNFELINPEAVHIECINGFFKAPVGDAQSGIEIQVNQGIEESKLDHRYEFFSALNLAYKTSSITIKVARNTVMNKSIQFNFLNDGNGLAAQPHVAIEVEEGAEANFILNWQGSNTANNFINTASEIKVGQNASASLHLLQQPGDENYLINTTQVNQARDSRFAIHTISMEGKILRNNLNIDVEGEHCETVLNGVYLTHGKQHFDNHTYVDHIEPNCHSSENYKGVLADQSTAVFNGKVMVRQDAQKINAFQSNQNILLSDDATINSKPELEIYADDVQCSHGSTTGQMDEEALFYLQSRGVSEVSAKKMLVKAFVFDVLEQIKLDSFREHVSALVEDKFDY